MISENYVNQGTVIVLFRPRFICKSYLINIFLDTVITLSKDLVYLNMKEGFMYSPKNVLGALSLLFFSNTKIHVCM